MLLGVLILKEKLRPWQWLPIGLAAAGVTYIALHYGQLPWIALVLALTFGLYGLVKKTAPVSALHGLMVETSILFIPTLGYLLFVESQGTGAFGHSGASLTILLSLAGVATTTPLLMFASGARLIPLSTLGILQYVAPSAQLLLGILVYHEPFTSDRIIGFGMIWLALLIYSLEGILARRQKARLASFQAAGS